MARAVSPARGTCCGTGSPRDTVRCLREDGGKGSRAVGPQWHRPPPAVGGGGPERRLSRTSCVSPAVVRAVDLPAPVCGGEEEERAEGVGGGGDRRPSAGGPRKRSQPGQSLSSASPSLPRRLWDGVTPVSAGLGPLARACRCGALRYPRYVPASMSRAGGKRCYAPCRHWCVSWVSLPSRGFRMDQPRSTVCGTRTVPSFT